MVLRRWPQPPARVPQAARVPPATAALIGEGFDPPFGGWAGETTAVPPPEDAPQPPAPLQIEAPPWAGRAIDPAELAAIADAERPADTMSALDAIKAADGYDPEPPRLEPPIVLAPLVRFKPPAPDWRAELAEREAQQ